MELCATGDLRGGTLDPKGPRYPVMVLVAIERVVVDENELTGLRVYAWAKLVKAWTSKPSALKSWG